MAEETNVTYDSVGNVSTIGNTIGKWTTTYNDVNWPTSVTDPTGVTSCTCYNEDGSVSATTSAIQYQMDGAKCGENSEAYQHDTDGDLTGTTSHYNSTPGSYTSGMTTKWYDGLDRLVEVEPPSGANIDNNSVSKTRYIYDLTSTGGAGNLSVGNISGVAAYGNLYKTQRCIGSSCNWGGSANDVNGNAYDAADRPTARYQYSPTTSGTPSVPGSTPGPLGAWTIAYDGSGQYGLPTTEKDPLGTHTTFAYDGVNRLESKSFDDGSTPTVNVTYDLDERVAILASPGVGTENYAYDYDGRLQSYGEGGDVNDPELLAYSYYANGWPSSLAISDPSASYNQSYGYDYRADGARKDLTLGSQSFSWTYDNAGRVQSQTDPLSGTNIPSNGNSFYPAGITIGPKLAQYNGQTGLLSQLTLPNGAQYTGITHDAEGEVTAYGVSFPAFSSNQQTSPYVTGVQFTYDKRGEFIQTSAIAPSVTAYQTLQQLQYLISHPVDGAIGAPYEGIDSNTGAEAGLFSPSLTDANGCTESQSVSYDADGRQQRDFVSYAGSKCQNPSYGPVLADSRSYDAENRLIQDTCSYAQEGQFYTICAAGTYTFDPSGHLRTIGSDTLHWDGNTLLFITDASHNVVQTNVEKLAWRNKPNGNIVVKDRDFSGTSVDQHSVNADNGLAASQDLYGGKVGLFFGIPTINGQYPGLATGNFPLGVIGMDRIDGYQQLLSAVTFQGARTYDSNTTQWTTPDDYKGDVADPMSQMAYQWNDNNPLANSDPSGYCSTTVWQGDEPHTEDYGDCDDYSVYAVPTYGASGEPFNVLDVALGSFNVSLQAANRKAQKPVSKGKTAPTCAVVPGGELVPEGCVPPPNPTHPECFAKAFVGGAINPATLFGSWLGGSVVAGRAITVGEAAGTTNPLGWGAFVGGAMSSGLLSGINAAYGRTGCNG